MQTVSVLSPGPSQTPNVRVKTAAAGKLRRPGRRQEPRDSAGPGSGKLAGLKLSEDIELADLATPNCVCDEWVCIPLQVVKASALATGIDTGSVILTSTKVAKIYFEIQEHGNFDFPLVS